MAKSDSPISIDFDPKHVNEAITQYLTEDHTKDLLTRIGAKIRSDVILNFRRETAPDDTPWKSIKRPGQILTDTGRLRRSFNYGLDGADTVRVGTNVKYAKVHQFGYAAKNIAARPFMGIAARQTKKINDIVDKWADELLEQAAATIAQE